MKKSFVIGLFSIATLTTAAAHAQQGNKAAAEAMFDEGLRLFDAGQFQEACVKFAASERIDPATGTLLNLARCYETTGKTASAWATYREVQALARKEGNARRETLARTHELDLQPKLSRLTIVLAQPAGVVVRLDDVSIDAAELQTPLPIDPGMHHLDASAPGKKSRRDTVTIGNAASTSFTIPALEDEAAPKVIASTPTNDHAAESHGMPAVRVVALISGGVGLVGIGVGSAFGLSALSKASDSNAHCHPLSGCDSTGTSLRSSADTFADLSTVAFAVGGVALATGVVLWLTSSPSRSTSASASASVQLLPSIDPQHQGAGLWLRGSL